MHIHIKEALGDSSPGHALAEPSDVNLAAHLGVLVGPSVAKKTLAKVGAYGLARRSVAELVAETGLRPQDARRIVAARELSDALTPSRRRVVGPGEVELALPAGFERFEREVMLAIVLNGQLERLATILLAAGGAQMLCLTPVDVLRPVVRFGGVGFILVHNHPSGDPTPSEVDVTFTNKITKAAQVLGLDLLDHVIVGERGTSSFFELGLLLTEAELEQVAS
jgi:DNA repair protein RadC